MTIPVKAAVALVTLMVAWAVPLRAQEPGPSRAGAVTAAQPADGEGGPLAVVAQFLSLAPEQVQALTQLLRERQETVGPLLQEIARREQRIRELVASGGDPAEVGRLVIEIHHLRQLGEAAQAGFLARFGSLLTEEQRRKWRHVRIAARLQPVLPAFQALQML